MKAENAIRAYCHTIFGMADEANTIAIHPADVESK